MASLGTAGIGTSGNVYAELGSTLFFLPLSLDDAAHVLGKLLLHLVPERTGCGARTPSGTGSPQGQIDAFRAFAISTEFQERFGYPR